MSSWVGFRRDVVEYDRAAREAGRTKFPLGRMIRFALDGVTSFSNFPLQLAAVAGFACAAIALLLLPLTIVARYSGIYERGVPSLLFAVLLIGGIQLLALGMIGEYLGRIYDEVKQRPLYVIARARNLDRDEGAGAAADGAWAAALLFVDGDLQETASSLGVLVPAVLDGTADMTIATLPTQITAGGGRGLVVGLSRRGIESLTGFRAVQPLSGMRCLSPAAYTAAAPLARGWGVETGLTVDVLRAGLTVLEVPCELQHRVSGSDWRGHLHRAGQYRDVWLALVRRGWRPWHRG